MKKKTGGKFPAAVSYRACVIVPIAIVSENTLEVVKTI